MRSCPLCWRLAGQLLAERLDHGEHHLGPGERTHGVREGLGCTKSMAREKRDVSTAPASAEDTLPCVQMCQSQKSRRRGVTCETPHQQKRLAQAQRNRENIRKESAPDILKQIVRRCFRCVEHRGLLADDLFVQGRAANPVTAESVHRGLFQTRKRSASSSAQRRCESVA